MIATSCATADAELVTAVRQGDDASFEELYRRYQPRIAAFVRSRLRDEARAEDVTQEAFLSALRRLRVTDSEINFKPWIYEIARNATIDSYRRSSRAEEISMDADSGLRPSDRLRLVGDSAPDSTLIDKERFDHLRGAFDELSDVHTRVLVMRELEGCSYREIGEKLDLTRPAVESALFRARRRLETEYAELSEGRRCRKARAIIARLAEGMDGAVDHQRLARHAHRCHSCRRWARELGVEPQAAPSSLRAKVAALLPLPIPWLPSGTQFGAGLGERAAALIAAAALAGAGGAAIGGSGLLERDPAKPAAIERETVGERTTRQATPRAGSPRGAADRARDDQARRSADRARAKRDAGSGDAATGAPAAGGPAAGPGDSAPLGGAGLPGVPDAPDAPDVSLPPPDVPTDGRLPVPELPETTVPLDTPQVAPGVSVPEVSVPEVGTRTIDGVTGAVQDALP